MSPSCPDVSDARLEREGELAACERRVRRVPPPISDPVARVGATALPLGEVGAHGCAVAGAASPEEGLSGMMAEKLEFT